MTAALYVRTSTDDQDGAGQLHELSRAAEARGWCDAGDAHLLRGSLVSEYRVASGVVLYRDRGESGAKASRPEWDKVRAAVRRGEVRRLMVSELSRLGRNTSAVVVAMDELTRAGCELVVLREGFDYSTDAGKLIGTIFAALAQFERSQINARTRSKLQALKAQGVKLGRREVSVPMEDIARLHRSGATLREIAQATGIKRSTVARRLAALNAQP